MEGKLSEHPTADTAGNDCGALWEGRPSRLGWRALLLAYRRGRHDSDDASRCDRTRRPAKPGIDRMNLQEALETAEETDAWERALISRDEWMEASVVLAAEVRRLAASAGESRDV